MDKKNKTKIFGTRYKSKIVRDCRESFLDGSYRAYSIIDEKIFAEMLKDFNKYVRLDKEHGQFVAVRKTEDTKRDIARRHKEGIEKYKLVSKKRACFEEKYGDFYKDFVRIRPRSTDPNRNIENDEIQNRLDFNYGVVSCERHSESMRLLNTFEISIRNSFSMSPKIRKVYGSSQKIPKDGKGKKNLKVVLKAYDIAIKCEAVWRNPKKRAAIKKKANVGRRAVTVSIDDPIDGGYKQVQKTYKSYDKADYIADKMHEHCKKIHHYRHLDVMEDPNNPEKKIDTHECIFYKPYSGLDEENRKTEKIRVRKLLRAAKEYYRN